MDSNFCFAENTSRVACLSSGEAFSFISPSLSMHRSNSRYKEGSGFRGSLTKLNKGKSSCFSMDLRTCRMTRNSFKTEIHCNEPRNSLSLASSSKGRKLSKESIGKDFSTARNSTISAVVLSA